MIWLEKLIKAISPTVVLEGSPWESEWQESQRRLFVRGCRAFFPLISVGYVLHYYFFDQPSGLEPLEGWFAFRMTSAVLFALAALFYMTSGVNIKWYKVPATIATATLCTTQAYVTYYYPPAPWLYPFLFIVSAVILLRLSSFQSIIYACAVIALILQPLIATGIDPSTLVSASAVTVIIVAVIRSAYSFEVSNFLLNKTSEAQQQANIELQQEFSDRIKSFIPAVIAKRIQHRVAANKSSVMEASVDILRPQTKPVACLFSDIRGFTQSSKNLESFVNASVIPEVKAVSSEIENFEGIPRKIGDLIFAYYDDERVQKNVARAVLSGINLSRRNKAMNETVASEEIKRYIPISCGNAVVGNLGGLDSSVEIEVVPISWTAC